MKNFIVHTHETAPDDSKSGLESTQKKYGFLPNLFGVFAESPKALEAYSALSKIFGETTLSLTEQQVVLLSVSYENRCDYCMAAHSTVAKMTKVPDTVIEALRSGDPLPDKKLEALRTFARSMVTERGWISDEAFQGFLNAGYSKSQALEVIVGISMKTMSNYTNHLSQTPVDEAFEPMKWKAP